MHQDKSGNPATYIHNENRSLYTVEQEPVVDVIKGATLELDRRFLVIRVIGLNAEICSTKSITLKLKYI
jgi:hypothetical protein